MELGVKNKNPVGHQIKWDDFIVGFPKENITSQIK